MIDDDILYFRISPLFDEEVVDKIYLELSENEIRNIGLPSPESKIFNGYVKQCKMILGLDEKSDRHNK